MSDGCPVNDEINLFDLCELLWDQKWVVAIVMGVVIASGLAYSQIVVHQYEVTIPYKVNIYPVSEREFCSNDAACLEFRTANEMADHLQDGWTIDSKNFTMSLVTDNPSSVADYDAAKKELAKTFTSEVYRKANADVALITGGLDEHMQSADVVAADLLNAKRVIRDVEGGQNAVDFGSVVIVRNSPRVGLILALSALLGGFGSALYAVVLNAFRKRRDRALMNVHLR